MLAARSICVQTGAKKILSDVSLEIRPGEILVLLGANGAGKSTLLRALCGEARLSRGEVRLDERLLRDFKHCEMARRRAVLSQHAELSFPFTVLEVALLGRNPHLSPSGRETRRDLEIAWAALETVEAAHLAERVYPTLSGGERQRVHLARVLAQVWEKTANPRYLLLDEPTASLDLAHQHLTLRVARRFASANAGVIVVLHDLNLAAQYADRICLLRNGEVMGIGAPSEILTEQNIEAAFDFSVEILRHRNRTLIVPAEKIINRGEFT